MHSMQFMQNIDHQSSKGSTAEAEQCEDAATDVGAAARKAIQSQDAATGADAAAREAMQGRVAATTKTCASLRWEVANAECEHLMSYDNGWPSRR
jgi:flagellar hook-length control protein FliK